MACIRVERIVDYLCEPLHRTLHDESPYVRKTAVICVAKLFDISPDLVDENGFLDTLKEMLTDTNPMVVSTVVSALTDIHEADPSVGALDMDSRNVGRLVSALADCTEWGQIAILETLAKHTLEDMDQLEFQVESVIPRLQHANPAIVLAAIKVLCRHMERLPVGHDLGDAIKKKLGPPLVTLLSSSHLEIQYVALRNAGIILQRWPDLLSQSIRVFFAKYNDPLYVKLEKLRLIVLLANDENVEQIYPELADYAKEVDIDFVRNAIKCVGQVAVKIPKSVHLAVQLLLELSKTDVSYVVQEVLTTSQTILRSISGSFGYSVCELCRDPSLYDEPEAEAAFIWIIGEYGHNAHPEYIHILNETLDNFKLKTASVQAQLFSSILKLYVHDPEQHRNLMILLVEKGKSSFDNIEARDRAVFYERLLKLDVSLVRSLDINPPRLECHSNALERSLLALMMAQLGTLSSVYLKRPEEFLTWKPIKSNDDEDANDENGDEIQDGSPNQTGGIPVDLLGGIGESNSFSNSNPRTTTPANLIDLLS